MAANISGSVHDSCRSHIFNLHESRSSRMHKFIELYCIHCAFAQACARGPLARRHRPLLHRRLLSAASFTKTEHFNKIDWNARNFQFQQIVVQNTRIVGHVLSPNPRCFRHSFARRFSAATANYDHVILNFAFLSR